MDFSFEHKFADPVQRCFYVTFDIFIELIAILEIEFVIDFYHYCLIKNRYPHQKSQ